MALTEALAEVPAGTPAEALAGNPRWQPAQKPPFCLRQHILEPFRITLKTCSRDDICLNQL